jgi:diguanylate cyclase (GGDEF)-like protein/PAS domain S-box-containing protein
VLNPLPLNAWVVDASGVCRAESAQARQRWGPLQGSRMPPEDPPQLAEGWHRRHACALAGEAVRESAVVHDDGQAHYGTHVVAPVRLAGGATAVLHLFVNTTTAERGATDLAKWKHVVDHLELGVSIDRVSPAVFEWVNPAFARMHGWAQDELAGKPVQDVFSPTACLTLPMHIAQAHAKGHHVFESEGIRKDGSTFPVVVNVTAVRGQGGTVLYRAAIVQDISDRKRVEAVLRQSEEKYRKLFLSDLHPLAIVDLETLRVLDANPAWLALYGYSLAELRCRTALDLVANSQAAERAFHELRARHRMRLQAQQHRRKDGSLFIVALGLAMFELGGREVALCEVQDLTEQTQAQKALLDSEERFRSIVEVSSDWYWELDEQLRFCTVTMHRSPHVDVGYFIGRTFGELQGADPDSIRAIERHLALRASFRDAEICVTTAQGEALYLRCAGLPITDTAGAFRGYRGIAQDITIVKRAQQLTERMARYDELTGLLNRAALNDEAGKRISAGAPFCLLLLDLDRFKVINDSLGHHIGDALLKQVGARLQTLADDEHAVFRLGGDEFVLLLPARVEEHQVRQLLHRATGEPYVVEGFVLNTGCSAGMAEYPQDGSDLHALLKNADTAMYRAKRRSAGVGIQRYSAEMHARAMERLSLEQDLRRALRGDEHFLVYQPKVAVDGDRVTGMEALVRWRHPTRGLIQPGAFLSVAEETGLIIEMGERVLRMACEQAQRWRLSGLPELHLSVNISPQQFNRSLLPVLERVLGETGYPASLLELEITENALMANLEEAVLIMRTIAQRGVRLALDDFGTGYSSLTHLKRFPLATLKLDGSFVHELAMAGEDRAIVEAMVTMARVLRLKVVAEGIETAGQLAVLRDIGCDEYQGFYFSAPVTADEFAQRFLSRPV